VKHDLAPQVKDALMGRWEPVYRSQLHYLVTWSTRGRRPVLKDRHVRALKALIESISTERGYHLVEVAAGWDHVHVLMALRPSQSVASVVRELKGRSGVALIADHPELRVWLRGHLVWDERYAVETVSAARVDRVIARLRSQHAAPEHLAQAS
jgi:REP element-mobilizing transposase RayT